MEDTLVVSLKENRLVDITKFLSNTVNDAVQILEVNCSNVASIGMDADRNLDIALIVIDEGWILELSRGIVACSGELNAVAKRRQRTPALTSVGDVVESNADNAKRSTLDLKRDSPVEETILKMALVKIRANGARPWHLHSSSLP